MKRIHYIEESIQLHYSKIKNAAQKGFRHEHVAYTNFFDSVSNRFAALNSENSYDYKR